uniref:Uncharacterized protein n=1 Tax=Arundo donax TaxID=35708 RepID=A0A0A8Z1U7_ARUDO
MFQVSAFKLHCCSIISAKLGFLGLELCCYINILEPTNWRNQCFLYS